MYLVQLGPQPRQRPVQLGPHRRQRPVQLGPHCRHRPVQLPEPVLDRGDALLDTADPYVQRPELLIDRKGLFSFSAL